MIRLVSIVKPSKDAHLNTLNIRISETLSLELQREGIANFYVIRKYVYDNRNYSYEYRILIKKVITTNRRFTISLSGTPALVRGPT